MHPHTSPCRHCDSSGHHVSRLRPFDWPLYVIGFIPIRCKNCGARTYKHRLSAVRRPGARTSSKLDQD